MTVDRFTIMKSFTAVARCGSFATAARSLSISRALVSRHIADLEKQVGIRLLNRTTRSVTLTEPGITYLEFCRRILAEIADQDAQMSGLSERTFNFVDKGYDIAFHTKYLRDSSITVKKIAPLHFALCASPDYLARR